MLCLIWLDRKYFRWTCATATLYINIYLHREYRKTSFICCLIVTTENLIWPVVFLFFVLFLTCLFAALQINIIPLLATTSRGIIFICSAAKRQVILLREKFNIGYNFVPFLSLKQKSARTGSAIGELTSIGTNLHHIQVCR